MDIYSGWEIHSFLGKMDELSVGVHLKYNFNGDSFSFEKTSYGFVIYNYSNDYSDFKCSITFGDCRTELDAHQTDFKVKFESAFFGSLKSRKQEVLHRRFLREVLSRIPWKRQVFLIQNGKRIPYSKRRKRILVKK